MAAGAPNYWALVNEQSQATIECTILMDMFFDAIDQRFEPCNTGLCEASKVIAWMKLVAPANDCELFEARDYRALAIYWTVAELEHIMVPDTPSLRPLATSFGRPNQYSPAMQPIQITASAQTPALNLPRYIPALTRRGYMQWTLQELVTNPDDTFKYQQLLFPSGLPYNVPLPSLSYFDKRVPMSLQERINAVNGKAADKALSDATDSMVSSVQATEPGTRRNYGQSQAPAVSTAHNHNELSGLQRMRNQQAVMQSIYDSDAFATSNINLGSGSTQRYYHYNNYSGNIRF